MLMSLFQVTLDFTQAATDSDLPGAGTTFGQWLSRILSAILVVGAFLVLIYLLWGGLSWITAGGDSSKVASAREKIIQSLIGLVVLSAVLAIFTLVQSLLGIEAFVFSPGLPKIINF